MIFFILCYLENKIILKKPYQVCLFWKRKEKNNNLLRNKFKFNKKIKINLFKLLRESKHFN